MTKPSLPDLTSGNNIIAGSEETSCYQEPWKPLLLVALPTLDSVYRVEQQRGKNNHGVILAQVLFNFDIELIHEHMDWMDQGCFVLI